MAMDSKASIASMDWEELERNCLQCRRCALGETRKNVVFGVGRRDAELLFIGEGPGADEDRLGEPFVGRAGKFLDDWLRMIELDRSMVYIANIVKCRPPQNRDPLNNEQLACMEWLTAQIGLIKPRIIVCLGRIAAMTIINPEFKISRDHGRWYYREDGVKMMALYHPAALLRNPKLRPETFVDLKTLQAELLGGN